MSWWWPFSRANRVVLYGYNLARWDFLGTTEISFEDEQGRQCPRAYIAFFIRKDRSYRETKLIGIGHYSNIRVRQLRNHPFYVIHALQWQAGENALYSPVKNPSNYLCDYMRETNGMVWDNEERSWCYLPPKQPKPPRLRKKKVTSKVINFRTDDEPPS